MPKRDEEQHSQSNVFSTFHHPSQGFSLTPSACVHRDASTGRQPPKPPPPCQSARSGGSSKCPGSEGCECVESFMATWPWFFFGGKLTPKGHPLIENNFQTFIHTLMDS